MSDDPRDRDPLRLDSSELDAALAQEEAGALEAIKRLKDLDRRGVRNVFERRFTSHRMAQDYLRHYQDLVDNANTEANSIRPRPASSSGRAGSEKRK